MPTQKQLDANRANAQKSTGPRTPEGKSASSMNALKSGIDAKSQIVRGEKAANLEILKSEYYDHYRPTTPDQRMLVDTLIDSEWVLRRLRIVEAQLWEYESRNMLRPEDDVALGQAFHENDEIFGRLHRRVTSTLKTYHAALKELRRLQAETSLVADPLPQPNQPVNCEIGFVPQPAALPHANGTNPPVRDVIVTPLSQGDHDNSMQFDSGQNV